MWCRRALCLTSLLLVAAEAAHAGARWSHWRQGADGWAAQVEQQLLAWQYNLAAAVDAHAVTAAARPRIAAAGRSGAAVPALLHVTLRLPNHQTVEVGEDSTPEELMQTLIRQGGQLPTAIEVVSVQHTSRRQRSSHWRSALRAATASAAAKLGRPASWRLPAAAVATAAPTSSSESKEQQDAPEAAYNGMAIDDGSVGAADAYSSSTEEYSVLPVSAFDDAAVDDADSSTQQQLPAAVLPAATASKRVPAIGTAAIALQGLLSAEPVRRTLQQQADEGNAHMWEGPQQQQTIKLFGPGPLKQQQQATERQHQQRAVKLFGPGPTEQQVEETATEASQPLEQLQPEEAATMVVRVVVMVRPTGPQQQRQWNSDELLDQLALPQREAAAEARALLLGRKLAAGERLPVYYGGQEERQPGSSSGTNSALLAAVDAVFVVACGVAAACVTLLAADIWRHGWQPEEGAVQREQQYDEALLAPLVVVAAHEVAPAWQTDPHARQQFLKC